MSNASDNHLLALCTNQAIQQRLLTLNGGELAVTPIPIVRGRPASLQSVANRCFVPAGGPTNTNAFMNRRAHYARDFIPWCQLVIPNWTNVAGAETGSGGALTVGASIEYPAGNFTQVTFGGATAFTIPNGGQVVSDPCTLSTVIPANARFWTRFYQHPAGSQTNILSPGAWAGWNTQLGDAQEQTLTDKTMSGTVVDRAAGAGAAPLAILGPSSRACVVIIGDSRQIGLGDSVTDISGDYGELQRAIGGSFAVLNLGCSGDTAAFFAVPSQSANKRALIALIGTPTIGPGLVAPGIMVCGYGINDLVSGGATPATLIANLVTIYNQFPNFSLYQTTLTCVATSTDGFATLVNQTTDPHDANRQNVNNQFRQGYATMPANVLGYIEQANLYESTPQFGGTAGSGKWAVPNGVSGLLAYTSDGVHQNTLPLLRQVGPLPFPFLRIGNLG